ncbi:hypothetical protein HN51_067264 [Arachis hypogaea]
MAEIEWRRRASAWRVVLGNGHSHSHPYPGALSLCSPCLCHRHRAPVTVSSACFPPVREETSLDIGMDEAAFGTEYLDGDGDLGNDVRGSSLTRPEEVMEMMFNSPDEAACFDVSK